MLSATTSKNVWGLLYAIAKATLRKPHSQLQLEPQKLNTITEDGEISLTNFYIIPRYSCPKANKEVYTAQYLTQKD